MGDHMSGQPRLDDDVGDGGGFGSKDYLCQKCGKGFGSLRAVYGHLRVHSKRSRVLLEEEAAQEITRPVLKKRSTMGLEISSSAAPSFSTPNKLQPVVSEFDEVEEAAACLMMLSRGVRSCNEEDDDEDEKKTAVVNGDEKRAESEVFVERVLRTDQLKKFNVKMGSQIFESGLQKVEVCMQLKMSYSSGKRTGMADSEMKKKIPKTEPIFSSSCKKTGMADSEMKKEIPKTQPIFSSSCKKTGMADSEMKKEIPKTEPIFSSSCKKTGMADSEMKKEIPETEPIFSSSCKKTGMADSEKKKKIPKTEPIFSSSCKKTGMADSEMKKKMSKAKPIFSSSYEKAGVADDDHKRKVSEKKPELECSTCYKSFNSHQALGGQRTRQNITSHDSSMEMSPSGTGASSELQKIECVHANPLELGSSEDVIAFPNSTGCKYRKHECPVCFKVFASGQALGGHKRTRCPGFKKSKVKKECVNANQIELGSNEDEIAFPNSTGGKCKEHECPVCFKVFASGQALGGHRRTCFTGSMKSK